jgi:hypothetical protein
MEAILRFKHLKNLYLMLFIAFFGLVFSNQGYGQNSDPCDAIRWTGGAHWNDDGTINDLPNNPPPHGIIRCGSAAETQSNISSTGFYDPTSFTIGFDNVDCIDPSSGEIVTADLPTPGEPIIWLNFDVRPYANDFQIQINDNAGDNIAWILYYNTNPTSGTSAAANGQQLSGDLSCGNANYVVAACGVESSSTWNQIPVPEFPSVSNYFLVIWDQDADGDLSVNNFKARFGCSAGDLCNVVLEGWEELCNGDGTYSVNVKVKGVNGLFHAADINSIEMYSDTVCFTNLSQEFPDTAAVFTLTYPVGTPYNISVAEISPVPGEVCADPLNSDSCLITGIMGESPPCCGFEIVCPETDGGSYKCIASIPDADNSLITVVQSCGVATITHVDEDNGGSGCASDPFVLTRTYTVTDSQGNTANCVQTFTVVDDLAPVAPTAPADLDLQCAGDVPAPVDLTAVDNCDGDITVSPSELSTPGDCPNSYTLVRTWNFVDGCGNASSVSQTINVNDNKAPVAPAAPADLDLQ